MLLAEKIHRKTINDFINKVRVAARVVPWLWA